MTTSQTTSEGRTTVPRFDTKVVVLLGEDLAAWQELNVTTQGTPHGAGPRRHLALKTGQAAAHLTPDPGASTSATGSARA